MSRGRKQRRDPHEEAFRAALNGISFHPMFQPLLYDPTAAGQPYVTVRRDEENAAAQARGWAKVYPDGLIEVNAHQHGTVAEWTWVLAHCLLHLGFGHLDPLPSGATARRDRPWAAACCVAVARFQAALRLGEAPTEVPAELPGTDEETLAGFWRDTAVPPQFAAINPGGSEPDLTLGPPPPPRRGTVRQLSWSDRLSLGLSAAATAAVDHAGEIRRDRGTGPDPNTAWERARRWFVSGYPLLAALATGFTVVADRELARHWDIAVAAVHADSAEIYINPFAVLTEPEWRFVLAHEMLHAALRHGDRTGGRDPYLWNVACDYVVNGWLVEMAVGAMPDGLLYDPDLAGLSAETVYDRIATDLRRLRRLATLRGRGLGDMLHDPAGRPGDPTGIDEFCRRALLLGLARHDCDERGLLPAGLVEEIRVLDHPPLPWDAQLARWFDEHVPAVETRRTYARPSRRQSATPDIPRPGRYLPDELEARVSFGVVLDTSGSMDRRLLGLALGAIASFALARGVPAARVVYCDAVAYDAGYVPVTDIADGLRVRGRGGTVLQPGIRLLERADDFPATGPILIITDGWCDVLRVRREHAYLVPAGAQLPFTPRGPVFRMR